MLFDVAPPARQADQDQRWQRARGVPSIVKEPALDGDSLTPAQFEELLDADREASIRWAEEQRFIADYGGCECRRTWGCAADDPDHGFVHCDCACGNCRDLRHRAAWVEIRAGTADSEACAAWRAEEEARRVESQARREEEDQLARERYRAARAEAEENGPVDGPRTSGDPVGDIRRMAAWSSCRDSDLAGTYDNLFLQRQRRQDALIELRSGEDCTDPIHIRSRRECPDLTFCDAGCDSTFRVVPVGGWRALKDYFHRHCVAAMDLPDGCARWLPVDLSADAFQLAWAAQYWPGVKRLVGFHDLRSGTLLRPDGTIVTHPGFDKATGVWCVAGAGQAALPAALASQLAAVAAGGGWTGTLSQLAELLRWTQHVNALVRAIKAAELELRALGVTCSPTGRRTGRTRAAEWAVRLNLGPPGLRASAIEG
jgi:hypothetical protein